MEYTKQNGTVPTSPPVPGYPVAVTEDMPQQQAWSTGLFNCFDDFNICCLTFWCPCITFGRIAEIVDKGNTSCGTAGSIYALLALTGFQWAYSCIYRSRMRAQNNLQASPCADCCVHFCFESLALCQMSRELKNRGWDLNLGYGLNLEKKGSAIQQQAVVAPASQAMTR